MIDQIRLNRAPLIWERRRRKEVLLEIRDVTRTIRAIRKQILSASNPDLLQQTVTKLQTLIDRQVEAYLRPPVPPD
jgi:hypothetical protein